MRAFFITFFFAVATLCSEVKANPVSYEAALNTAKTFSQKRKAPGINVNSSVNLSFTRQGSEASIATEAPLYYVFNVADEGGFVIVSGDDVATPVLAYGDEGSFDHSQMPEHVKSWLDGYAEAIAWARQNNISTPVSSVKSASRKSVEYMVKAKWGQTSPYYLQTPKSSGYYCYTGCIATAMAQIMYYWATQKDFKCGSEAIPAYTTTSLGLEVAALDAIDHFEWDSITATKPTTTGGKQAVAQLMRYCGQAVKMDYTRYGSGAREQQIAVGMHTYFGYDRRARLVSRANVEAEEWEELLYQEIAAGRPVCMNGYNLYKGSAHEFVCDGYNATTDKYHFNWGWNGDYNGYYAINALNPKSSVSYNDYKAMVVGIQPETGDDSFQQVDYPFVRSMYLTGSRSIARSSRANDGDEDVSFYGAWKMETAMTGTFDWGFGIYDSDNNLVELVDTVTAVIQPYEFHQYECHFKFGAELPYGDYLIVPVCRLKGQEEWVRMNDSSTKHLTANVSADAITLSTSYDVVIDGITSTASSSTAYKNVLQLTNRGTMPTMGVLTMFHNDEEVAWKEPQLQPGASESATINYTKQITGNSNFVITSDELIWHRVYDSNSNYGDVLWRLTWDNYVDDARRLYGDVCKARLWLCNKGTQPYQQEVSATFFAAGSDVSSGDKQTQTVSLQSMESTVLEFDFSNFSYGQTYDLQIGLLSAGESLQWLASDASLEVKPTQGVVAVCPADTVYLVDNANDSFTVPEDAVYIDARYTALTDAEYSGGNSATLFVLADDAFTPESLVERNVVINHYSQEVALTDEREFFSPVEFDVDEITYSRTFTVGHGKSQEGWSTLVLPFDAYPAHVTVDGEPIPWYTSAEDSGCKFWIFAFEGDTDGTATFSYVSSIEPYQPYIIAVPDDSWGKRYDLRNKEIVIRGHGSHISAGRPKAVSPGTTYDFVGRTYSTERNRIHALNDAGSSFVYTTQNTQIAPYRAYFVSYGTAATPSLIMRLP